MISIYFTPAQYAIYSRGAMELPLVNIITYPIVAGLLMPTFVRQLSGKQRNTKEFVQLWQNTIRKIALIIFPIFVLLLVISRQFITLLYTDNYAGSVNIFRIYLFLALTNIAAYDVILQAAGKTRFVLYITTFALFFNLILNFILIKSLGVLGPPLATVITIFLTTGFYLITIKMVLQLSYTQVFPWVKLAKILIVAGIAGLLTFPLTHLAISKIEIIVIAGTVFSIIYVTLIYRFSLLQKDDLAYFQKFNFAKPTIKRR
jgi:O-antigen/teichoic acid export membrane protein